MKQIIRSFAFGLLTSGIVMLGVFYVADGSQSETENIPEEDMIEMVESKGYHVLTESEYISVSVESDENSDGNNNNGNQQNNSDETDSDKTSDSNSEQKSDSEKTDEDSSTTYTLTVESGEAPSEISQTLKENGIIDDADAFTEYLEDEGYSELVQLGEFELSSDMDHKKIAETLTN
ncbi:hypothetical protein GCM10007063_26970 [Lentibacillus kapialis]|uniref:Endolytic transglycosylase MltG n=1 Tax=Lentibacillus kapialis TaxID=340214 RepID=A0A917Q0E8_9BACI|nr:endolytic transglycosylase MltG [Lentibacillus kapialis]GGK03385.1 hypothetical protein GCM10007063_26970 [Lentibacillus kapialis]